MRIFIRDIDNRTTKETLKHKEVSEKVSFSIDRMYIKKQNGDYISIESFRTLLISSQTYTGIKFKVILNDNPECFLEIVLGAMSGRDIIISEDIISQDEIFVSALAYLFLYGHLKSDNFAMIQNEASGDLTMIAVSDNNWWGFSYRNFSFSNITDHPDKIIVSISKNPNKSFFVSFSKDNKEIELIGYYNAIVDKSFTFPLSTNHIAYNIIKKIINERKV